jgi:hypothetical protein
VTSICIPCPVSPSPGALEASRGRSPSRRPPSAAAASVYWATLNLSTICIVAPRLSAGPSAEQPSRPAYLFPRARRRQEGPARQSSSPLHLSFFSPCLSHTRVPLWKAGRAAMPATAD